MAKARNDIYVNEAQLVFVNDQRFVFFSWIRLRKTCHIHVQINSSSPFFYFPFHVQTIHQLLQLHVCVLISSSLEFLTLIEVKNDKSIGVILLNQCNCWYSSAIKVVDSTVTTILALTASFMYHSCLLLTTLRCFLHLSIRLNY